VPPQRYLQALARFSAAPSAQLLLLDFEAVAAYFGLSE